MDLISPRAMSLLGVGGGGGEVVVGEIRDEVVPVDGARENPLPAAQLLGNGDGDAPSTLLDHDRELGRLGHGCDGARHS